MPFRRNDRNGRKIFRSEACFRPLEIFARAPTLSFAQADARVAAIRALRVSICLPDAGRRTGARKPVRRHASFEENCIMSDLYFGTDLFNEFDRMQRQMASLFGPFPSSIRASRFGAFPTVNIGTTDDSIEIVAFAPGVDPTALDVSIDRGLLTISGERKTAQPDTTD